MSTAMNTPLDPAANAPQPDAGRDALERAWRPPSMRRSTSTRNLTPKVSAICCASTIIERVTARVPGSLHRTSSVAWVSALIGLNETLPHSFSQISSRMFSSTGALRPAFSNSAASAWMSSVISPDGAPNGKRSP